MSVYQLLWYFCIYSFLGWVLEVVFFALKKGRIVNRGFLNGPVCPVYGFGMVSVLLVSHFAMPRDISRANPLLLYLFGVIFATLVELIAGWLLDHLFHARWWDYSREKFNFHGYICLKFSLLWGLAVTGAARFLHAAASSGISHIPPDIGWILLLVFYALYGADLLITVLEIHGLSADLRSIDEVRRRMRAVSDGMSEAIGGNSLLARQQLEEQKLQTALAGAEIRDRVSSLKTAAESARLDAELAYADRKAELTASLDRRYEALRIRLRKSRAFGAGRLVRAFPGLRSHRYEEVLEEIKQRMRESETDGRN